MRASGIAIAGVLALAGPVAAEVVEAQPDGFEVRQSVQVAATPAQVYETLLHVGTWWDSAHTFSGDAAHLRLEPVAGGCFCETLPGGGSVAHLRVVFIEPGKAIRMEGALGPLQTLGGTGHLAWTLTPKAGGTEFVQIYDFGGYAKGGLVAWAGPVDGVLGQQAARMKKRAEGGTP